MFCSLRCFLKFAAAARDLQLPWHHRWGNGSGCAAGGGAQSGAFRSPPGFGRGTCGMLTISVALGACVGNPFRARGRGGGGVVDEVS